MASFSKTKKISTIAIFSALAFIVSLLEFPIFSEASFLQFDFSSVFVLLSGFMFGPLYAVICSLIKETLRFLTVSSTGGIGELANFIITFGLYIVPSIIYRFKKGLPIVIITLIIGCVVQTGLAVICNRFIMFPLYAGDYAKELFYSLWYFVVLFNIIKTVTVSLITVFLYKKICKLILKI